MEGRAIARPNTETAPCGGGGSRRVLLGDDEGEASDAAAAPVAGVGREGEG